MQALRCCSVWQPSQHSFLGTLQGCQGVGVVGSVGANSVGEPTPEIFSHAYAQQSRLKGWGEGFGLGCSPSSDPSVGLSWQQLWGSDCPAPPHQPLLVS